MTTPVPTQTAAQKATELAAEARSVRRKAIAGVGAGFALAVALVAGWSRYVHWSHATIAWEPWGASFAPITGWLSAAAVAIAFVAIYLQTHELQAQQGVMLEQLEEAGRHRLELVAQRDATAMLVDATRAATHVASLAAEVAAVHNLGVAIQELHAAERTEVFREAARAVESPCYPNKVEALARSQALRDAINRGDRGAFMSVFARTLNEVAPNREQEVLKAQAACLGLLEAHIAVDRAQSILETIREARQDNRPTPKTNDVPTAT